MSKSLRAPDTPPWGTPTDVAPPSWRRWVLAPPAAVARALVSGTGGPVGRRRRRDAVRVARAAVVVGLATAVAAGAGDTERVTTLWVGAEIAGDGSARVTEVIDYDFGSNDRHGVLREVPDLRAG